MNQLFRPADAALVREPPERLTTVRLGMPQLALAGIAESWLLKELGDIHWQMLAEAAGRDAPDFATERGEPVYAAFCALSMRDCRLDRGREGDRLTIGSRIGRLSRTQVASRHRLAIGEAAIGTVELVSTFVHRQGRGNHAVARFEVPGFAERGAGDIGRGLAAAAAEHRAGRLGRWDGWDLAATEAVGAHDFLPSPALDFNGAGFLYFASFLAFVDRAEWQQARATEPRLSITRRTVFFTGNLDPGEGLRVVIDGWRSQDDGALAHRMRLVAAETGAALATVFTAKTRAAR